MHGLPDAMCSAFCLLNKSWMLCLSGLQVDKAGLLTAMRNVANPPMELDALEVRWPCCLCCLQCPALGSCALLWTGKCCYDGLHDGLLL